MSELGPGCVKTCTSRECAELFSLFSSFDGDCQSGSFLIQRNRDKLSTRKPDVGVFTQPGSLLVAFVIGYPVFIAGAFFVFLWNKPVNLYKPQTLSEHLQEALLPERLN